ncbi:unnamed protein product [Effrenium voratum]|uniref:Uncharacterized protein n=1 Tax=Effrenium voratum TaxID=2562239 RepID=A0AA36MY51_9DINO|nr:unnamed protein product [Effrenium voratum]
MPQDVRRLMEELGLDEDWCGEVLRRLSLWQRQSLHEPGMDEGVLAEKGFDFRVLTFDIHCQRSYVQMCMQLFAVYSYSAYYAWFLVEAEASQERKPAKEAPSWFQRAWAFRPSAASLASISASLLHFCLGLEDVDAEGQRQSEKRTRPILF